MKAPSLFITVLILFAFLLAGQGTALSASYNEAVCGEFGQKLRRARETGGTGALYREMSRLLHIKELESHGLVQEEGVRCSLIASGDAYAVVNVALAAGIDRDTVKRGMERHFKFQSLQMPDLGIFKTGGRFRFEINIFTGVAVVNTVVGQTTGNEDVRLDGGGGRGGGMTMGYGLNHDWDLDLAMGYHVTDMDPEPLDTKGSFERWSALASFKYRLYAQARSWVKFGIGAGYFIPVRYKVEGPTGFYEIEYDEAPGGVASIEYEAAMGEDTMNATFVLGLRYYYVVYDATKWIINGSETPLTGLPDEFLELDGSSVEVTAGIATYF